ncbi:MAG: ATP-binding protein [Candidatus Omnitrophica bacterium]|nr:ATP-binding protein [Candidatus Omnitrophota bacterium]
MNLFSIFGLVIGLTTLFLAVLLLRFGNMRNDLHRSLFLLNIALVIWGFGCMMVGMSADAASALFWWKIAHIGGVFTVCFILENVLAVTESKKRWFLIFAYTEASLFQVFSFFDLLQVKMTYVFNSFYYITPNGIVYPIFTFCFLLVCYYSAIILVTALWHSQGQKRLQLKYHLFAFLFGIVGGTTHFFTVYFPNVFPYGSLLLPGFPLLTTYAILKHKFLNIEVIIKKTLVFAGLFASVFAMVILPTLILQEYIFRSASFGGKILGFAISGAIIILTMRRIESFLISITDKYLFQKKYDYKELLKTFTTEVLTVLDLDRLVNLTVDKIGDIMKISSASVLLLDADKVQFDVAASQGIKDPSVALLKSDAIVTFMEKTHGHILLSDMKKNKIIIPAAVQATMDRLNTELMIPMIMREEVTGILSLGKKKSDEEYTQDDLDILLPLARTLAIAISNAKFFDELSKTQAEAAQKEKMAVIGTLSAGINHEICNPLGIARGQCEAFLLNLKDGLYKLKTNEELLTKAKDIMAKVIHETDRATAITKKLSQFAKPAKGDLEIVGIDKEIDDVLGLVDYELKLEKIEIEKRLQENLPNIFVDKKQFQEVLFNLIRNAGQAIGEKGRIIVTARREKGKVYIDIKDSGAGIPPDKIKQLFNPFFTTKDPGKGTGLGLFIVRQVIEKNGGRIRLKETKVGEGTTFTLEFPEASQEDYASAKKGKTVNGKT